MLAVDFCHRMGVSNIDIKLENLLLTSSGHGGSSREVLKIADFGFSRDINNDSTPTTRLGALNYIAPEVMCQTSQDFEYDACQSDVWSCGVVLYAMLSATYPFKLSSTILSNIGNGFESCHANLLNEPFQPLSGCQWRATTSYLGCSTQTLKQGSRLPKLWNMIGLRVVLMLES